MALAGCWARLEVVVEPTGPAWLPTRCLSAWAVVLGVVGEGGGSAPSCAARRPRHRRRPGRLPLLTYGLAALVLVGADGRRWTAVSGPDRPHAVPASGGQDLTVSCYDEPLTGISGSATSPCWRWADPRLVSWVSATGASRQTSNGPRCRAGRQWITAQRHRSPLRRPPAVAFADWPPRSPPRSVAACRQTELAADARARRAIVGRPCRARPPLPASRRRRPARGRIGDRRFLAASCSRVGSRGYPPRQRCRGRVVLLRPRWSVPRHRRSSTAARRPTPPDGRRGKDHLGAPRRRRHLADGSGP